MALIHLSDDADPHLEWETMERSTLRVKRYMGPDTRYDPKDEGEPGYKLRDKAGRKGYVRAENVEHVDPAVEAEEV